MKVQLSFDALISGVLILEKCTCQPLYMTHLTSTKQTTARCEFNKVCKCSAGIWVHDGLLREYQYHWWLIVGTSTWTYIPLLCSRYLGGLRSTIQASMSPQHFTTTTGLYCWHMHYVAMDLCYLCQILRLLTACQTETRIRQTGQHVYTPHSSNYGHHMLTSASHSYFLLNWTEHGVLLY